MTILIKRSIYLILIDVSSKNSTPLILMLRISLSTSLLSNVVQTMIEFNKIDDGSGKLVKNLLKS